MKITEKTWDEYVARLSRLNETAGEKMADYIAKHGTEGTAALTAYAQALIEKYGGYRNRQDEGDVFATEVMLPIG